MSERDDREVFSPLESAGGTTTIADTVVSQIAGIAAGEVEDVRPAGSSSRRKGGLFGRSKEQPGKTPNVSAEVGRTTVTVHLTVGYRYGAKLPEVAERIRERVVNRVENLVGLAVTEVNLSVTGIVFPEQEEQGRGGGEARKGTAGDQATGTRSAGEESGAGPDTELHGEPGDRERSIRRAEPGSRADAKAGSGPVSDEAVRVEDTPVGTDGTRRTRRRREQSRETPE